MGVSGVRAPAGRRPATGVLFDRLAGAAKRETGSGIGRWRLLPLPGSLLVSLALVLLLALLGVLSNMVTGETGSQPVALLRQWLYPLLAATVALLLGATVWQHRLEHRAPPRRTWTGVRPPYPGLEAFTEEDASVFFGREHQIAELVDRLHPVQTGLASRFVAVMGSSGSGKSSLVLAGLLPRLAQRRRPWVVLPPVLPEGQPVENLSRSLATLVPDATASAVGERLRLGTGELGRVVAEVLEARRRSPSMLLVIDQAEELVTRASTDERRAFLRLIDEALAANPSLWVVATLRSEFLTSFLEDGFEVLFSRPVVLGTLTRPALFEAIEGPAALAGLAFEPGLVGRIVDDTEGGDALPLLAYTMQALYLRVATRGVVSHRDYESLGGVAGALSRQADRVAAELQDADAAAPVIPTLLHFTTLADGEPTRRRVERRQLTDAERRVVYAFVAARLLTSDARGDQAVVAVSHEALLRQWPPLRREIEVRAAQLRQRTEVERLALDWERSGRRDAYLVRDERLVALQRWATTSRDLVQLPLVEVFLDGCTRADTAALERVSEAVARQALAAIDRDPERALVLALAAIEECSSTRLAHRALLSALTASRVSGVLRGHQGSVRGVAWSPDGERLVTVSEDRTARVWDVRRRETMMILRGHEDEVRAVSWSPDGARIATASSDRTARIWDARSGQELLVLLGHRESVEAVAWSPDGRRLATASRDSTVRMWDAVEGTELAVLRCHTDWIVGLAWSPDGRRLATASSDHTSCVWDLESGREVGRLTGHRTTVRSVAWSPDGARIATASGDHTARIWDAERGSELLLLDRHTDWLQAVAWSPDGRRIATVSGDLTARIWDASTGTEQIILRGHSAPLWNPAWSPDSRLFATTSTDGTARIWEVEAANQLAVPLRHPAVVSWVSWSPRGDRLATASFDTGARVWDVRARRVIHLFHHQDAVTAAAWSPDGRRLATGCYDRTARVWDANRGDELLVMRGHTDRLTALAWSPDGRLLATSSGDRTVRIWDAAGGQEVHVLAHENVVYDVAWSPNGLRIATASRDEALRVWFVADGAVELELAGLGQPVRAVVWSPDGSLLASGLSDGTLHLWEASRGAGVLVCRGHERTIRAVAWSPDGRTVATGSIDGTARIWDVKLGAEVALLSADEQSVNGVAWSPDGRHLATASADGSAWIWEAAADLDSLLLRARARVFHTLSEDERRSLLLPAKSRTT